MALTSNEQLKEYILRQLGAPLVQVEVSDEQMNDIINTTIQEYGSGYQQFVISHNADSTTTTTDSTIYTADRV